MKATAKNLITIVTIIFIPFIMLGNSGNSENKKETNTNALVVKGKVQNLGMLLPGAYIKLYENNDVVVENKTKRDGSFTVTLKPNRQYVLEVIAQNHLTKRILFNTTIDSELSKVAEFRATFDLVPKAAIKGADVSELDFPYAIITYDESTQGFSFDQDYSFDMKTEEELALNYSYLLSKAKRKQKSRANRRSAN